MGFFDSIKTVISGGIDDYDDMDQDYDPRESAPQEDYRPAPVQRPQSNDERSRLNISVTAQLQVILVKPEKFADTKEIANHLNNKKTVVLNLEATTPDVTRRIIDFLGGVAYANGGSIKPVANNTFIITPYNVGFQGDELSAELESNGVLL